MESGRRAAAGGSRSTGGGSRLQILAKEMPEQSLALLVGNISLPDQGYGAFDECVALFVIRSSFGHALTVPLGLRQFRRRRTTRLCEPLIATPLSGSGRSSG